MNIRLATTVDDVAAVAALMEEVWGEALINVGLGRAIDHAGGYVAGAWEGGELVGGSVAFLGVAGDRPLLHSHATCAAPGAAGRGVGLALKGHQRDWCLQRGIDLMEWTYDPLVARNGWFNLGKLGAVGAEYLVDFYGRMESAIERGEESDRCLVRWELAAPRPLVVDVAAQRAAGVPVVLTVGADGGPVAGAEAMPGPLLAQVHPDIEGLRRTEPDTATTWRHAFREHVGSALQAGRRLVGASRDGWYLVAP